MQKNNTKKTKKKKTSAGNAILKMYPVRAIVRTHENKNGHETDLKTSPRPLGTTIFAEI